MNNKLRTNKGFTLIELVTAIAILAIVVSFAGVIFNVSIESYRTAMANAEIMQKLRAITDQLNADFKGLITSPPGKVDFPPGSDKNGRPVRADCIAFFANGDLQSTGQYGAGSKTVVGNVAAIFYGQAEDPNPNNDPNIDPFTGNPKEKILTRRQTILTSDPSLQDPLLEPPGEYYKLSLSEWIASPPIDPNVWISRPVPDPDFVTYMAKGVDNFTIEYWDAGVWRREQQKFVTDAFKFTFTLYDSKGIIKGGRTFTHIVYFGK